MANRTDQTALLRKSKRRRKVLNRVMTPIGKLVDESMLDAAATELGLLIDGQLYLTGEHDVATVLDFAMHELRTDAGSVVQRHLAQHPPVAGSTEATVLRALEAARFSVFFIDGVEPGVGIHVYDMLGGPARFVVDEALGEPAFLGDRFAGRLLSVGDITLSTGVYLPLDQIATEEILDDLLDRFPERSMDELHLLPPEDRAAATAIIARAGLEATDWMVEQALLEVAGDDPLLALETDTAEANPLPLPTRTPPASSPSAKRKKRR